MFYIGTVYVEMEQCMYSRGIVGWSECDNSVAKWYYSVTKWCGWIGWSVVWLRLF